MSYKPSKVAVMREAITKVTQILSGRSIKVIQQGMKACVQYDTKTHIPVSVQLPMIPDDASDELLDAVQGFLDHEVGHLLHTDGPTIITANTKLGSQGAQLLNMVEDVLVEKKQAAMWRGTATNMTNTGLFYLKNFVRPNLAKALAAGDQQGVISILMPSIIRALGGQFVFKEYLREINNDIANQITAKLSPVTAQFDAIDSTADSVAVTEAIIKLLKNDKEQPKPDQQGGDESEPQDGDEGEKQDSGQKGKGKQPKEEQPDNEDKKDDSDEAGDEEDDAPAGGDEEGDDEGTDDKDGEADAGQSDEFGEDEKEGDGGDDEGEPDETDADGEGSGEGEPDEADEDDEADGSGNSGADEKGDGDEEQEDADGTPDQDGEGSSDGDGDGDEAEGEGGQPGDETNDADAPDEGQNSTEEGGHENSTGESYEETQTGGLTWEDIANATEKSKDFDDAAAEAIGEDAAKAMARSPYVIWSTEYDEVKVLDVKDKDRNGAIDTCNRYIEGPVSAMVAPMTKELERAVAARSHALYVGGHRSGRLHSASLTRLKFNDDRVFRRKTETTTKDVAVELVVDISGSMGGSKVLTAARAAFALASVLDRLSIKNEVICFTTGHQVVPHEDMAEARKKGILYARTENIVMPIIKTHDEPMNSEVRARFGMMPDQIHMACNIDGESVEMAARRLLQRKASRHVMIVLSDGEPAGHSMVGRDVLFSDLKQRVQKIEKSGVDVVGIGIESNAVARFYTKNVVLNNVNELPTAVIRELRSLLIPK